MILAERFLFGGLWSVLGMLTFRALAPVAWLAFAPGSTSRQRCVGGVLTALAAISVVRVTSLDLLGLSVGYAYFSCAGSVAPLVADALRNRRVSSTAVFVGSAYLFLVCPGLYAPQSCRYVLLLIGWDVTLSTYSYCVEVARLPRPAASWSARVQECLFFLLVNPVLVYSQRGARAHPAVFGMRNVARIAMGLLTLFAASAALEPASLWVERHGMAFAKSAFPVAIVGASTVTVLACAAVLRFALEYLMQSGVADLQIAMVRQLGHDIPNRFNRPLLATGPIDFWRRWNLYVGAWVQRYVFWPLSLRLGRYSRLLKGAPGKGAAIVISFGVVGLLHDCVPYLTDLQGHYRGIFVFTIAGSLVIIWYEAERSMSASPDRVRSALVPALVRQASRAAFWSVTLALFTWWGK